MRRSAKIPQPHGGALNAGGTPGNRGGGRLPLVLKSALEEIRSDPKALRSLLTAARNASSKGFAVAWRLAARYDPDRPSEKLDVNLQVGLADRLKAARQRSLLHLPTGNGR